MTGKKIIAKNKRARYDFELLEVFEAGMVLVGTEVKSIRAGKVHIQDAFVTVQNAQKNEKAEAFIENMTISHYDFGNVHNHQETRRRKLLLNKSEIENLSHRVRAEGLTIVPTIIYFKGSRIKIEIALAKGKKFYDKRHDQAKKDVERKLQQKNYD